MWGECTWEGAQEGTQCHDDLFHQTGVCVGRVAAAEDMNEGSKKVRKRREQEGLDSFLCETWREEEGGEERDN